MAWKPHAYRNEKPACATCGTTSYMTAYLGDCRHTAGKVFCGDWCRITYRQRKVNYPHVHFERMS